MKFIKKLLVLCLLFTILLNNKVYAKYEYTVDDIFNITCLLNSEANTESEKGKKLVVDVILNRVDSEEFPNTLSEVLEQEGQFATVRKCVTYDNLVIVCDEINNRSNKKVLFFRTDKYHEDTVPIVKVGEHYFSGL